MEIRTQRGKLVGIFDESAGFFCIKDRNKKVFIEVPEDGLRIKFTPGEGKLEEIYIPSRVDKPVIV